MIELFYPKERGDKFLLELIESCVCDSTWDMIIEYSCHLILRPEEENIGAEKKYLRKQWGLLLPPQLMKGTD